MKNLKIVFFGGTKVHFDLSEKCSKLGAKCFILDKNKKCFANFSTDFYNIDFSNKYKTLNFIKSKKIDFIYISQSDAGLMTLGYINSKLKLPGVTYKIAKILSNKFKIRKILKSNNFYQPRFYLLSKKKNNYKKQIFFKDKNFIIKPVDSSASRGVIENINLNNIDKNLSLALRFSKKKLAIVEEKISGVEFGAQTFSKNGKCCHVILHEDIMSDLNSKIPLGHIVPFNLIQSKKIKNEIKHEIKRAINCLGVTDGPCNVDCIITKDNELFIIEVSPRIGATCLPEILFKYTSLDWDIATIKFFNYKKNFRIKINKINVISRLFESNKSGLLKKITFKKKAPYKSKVTISVKKNEKIYRFKNGTKSFGNIVAWSNSRKKLIESTNAYVNSIKLTLK